MTKTRLQTVTLFYALAFGMAILSAVAGRWIGDAALMLTMLTPTLAALAMLLFLAPEGRLRDIPARLGLNTAGLASWPLAVTLPIALHLAGMAVLAAAGIAVFVMPAGGIGPMAPDLLINLVIGALLALFEEMGWRGYLLPRLAPIGAVRAMVIVGMLHGLWHLPLLLGTDLYHPGVSRWLVVPLFLVTLTLAGVFYGFLRLASGSVWPVAIAHGAANTGWAVFTQANQTKTGLVEEVLGGESGVIVISGLLVTVGVLIWWMARPGLAARRAALVV